MSRTGRIPIPCLFRSSIPAVVALTTGFASWASPQAACIDYASYFHWEGTVLHLELPRSGPECAQ